MAALGRLISSMGRKAVIPGAIVGAGLSMNLIEGDEDTYGMQQALLEGVLGDPQADVAITGKRMDLFSTMVNPIDSRISVPGEGYRDRFAAMRHAWNNNTALENWRASKKVDRWQMEYEEDRGNNFTFYEAGDRLRDTVGDAVGIYDDGNPGGYQDYRPANTSLGDQAYQPRYVNRAQRDPAFGNIVLGAYNMRRG